MNHGIQIMRESTTEQRERLGKRMALEARYATAGQLRMVKHQMSFIPEKELPKPITKQGF